MPSDMADIKLRDDKEDCAPNYGDLKNMTSLKDDQR